MIKKKIPEKTIERLSLYRRMLMQCTVEGKEYIYSHELAGLLHFTAVQIRQDLMQIGYSGTLRKGYHVKDLINLIASILDSYDALKVAIFGMGNLGRAITTYFHGKRKKLDIVACFDVDQDIIGKVVSGVPCFSVNRLEELIKVMKISIGILTVPPDKAAIITERLVMAGIKGILNYTSSPVNVPAHVSLEEYDMITSLEKVAYFVKNTD